MRDKIERIIPGKEIPFTDISGAVRFGMNKVAEAAGPAGGAQDMQHGIDDDIPVTITKGNSSITLTMSEFEAFKEKVEKQLSMLRGGISFTDLAEEGQSGTDTGFDRAEGESLAGVVPAAAEEEPEQVPVQLPEPETEDIDEEDVDKGDAAEEKRPEGNLHSVGMIKTEAGRQVANSPERSAKTAPVRGNRVSPGKGGPVPGRAAKNRTVTRTPAKRMTREGAQKAASAEDRKKARTKKTEQARRKGGQMRRPAAPVKTSAEQDKGFRRLSLNEAEKRAGSSMEAEQLMAKAARITQVSGRETSFANKNGDTLVFRNEYDKEQGRDVTKGFINGKEVSVKQASDFIKDVTSRMTERQRDIITAAVDITLAQPDIRNKVLENSVQRQVKSNERGNNRG